MLIGRLRRWLQLRLTARPLLAHERRIIASSRETIARRRFSSLFGNDGLACLPLSSRARTVWLQSSPVPPLVALSFAARSLGLASLGRSAGRSAPAARSVCSLSIRSGLAGTARSLQA
jgi:hypothetical protein